MPRALARIVLSHDVRDDERVRLGERLAASAGELQRLAASAAAGVAFSAIHDAMANREAERERVRGGLRRLDGTEAARSVDRKGVLRDLTAENLREVLQAARLKRQPRGRRSRCC